MRKYDKFLSTDIHDLQNEIVNRILEMNPHVSLGEPMHGYHAQVRHGAHYQKPSILDVDLRCDDLGFRVPHVPGLQPEEIMTSKVQLSYEDDAFEIFRNLQGKYLHVHKLSLPYEKLLRNYKPGDVIQAEDDNYEISPFTITEEFLNERAYLTFSFAMSNGTPAVSENTK